MVSIRKIKENNEPQFLIDAKKCSEMMVYCKSTSCFLKVRKSEVMQKAESKEIRYYLTDKIFKVTRTSMVIV